MEPAHPEAGAPDPGRTSELIAVYGRLSDEVDRLAFSAPVTHVYNPMRYAWENHRRYLERARAGPEVVLTGMNPGPWGMTQTGVPFGEIGMVRDWLRIDGAVGRPTTEHPKRPVLGFDCPRSEVSGRRFWGWARRRFGTPERFFERAFVLNYCPLVFLEESGRNRTPDRLPVAEREPLLALCDAALREAIAVLRPRWAIGIGKFARRRLEATVADGPWSIGDVLHPSPASPAANRGWEERVDARLAELGVDLS